MSNIHNLNFTMFRLAYSLPVIIIYISVPKLADRLLPDSVIQIVQMDFYFLEVIQWPQAKLNGLVWLK